MPDQKWSFSTPGLPEGLFRQNKGVPLSRKEVRSLVMAGARLKEDSLVYDIGAGCGGFTVEAALQVKQGLVWAIERKAEALEALRVNVGRFGLPNIRIVEGEAPEALLGLPAPDRVLIGGSGGRLKEILENVRQVLAPGGRLVITSVQPDTLAAVLALLEAWPDWQAEALLAQFSTLERAGGARIWRGANPVVVVCAERV